MKKPGRTSAPSQRGVHDLGGLPAGQIDAHEHTPTLTERRIDAMMGLLRDDKRQFWTTDENRRTIENMAPEMYEGTGYYERWVLAMRGLLIEKGVLTEAEIETRLDAVRARQTAQAEEAKNRAGPAAEMSKTSTKPGARARSLPAEKSASKGIPRAKGGNR